MAHIEVLEEGEMAYPLLVELDDIHQGPLSSDGVVNLFVTAFAEELAVWRNLAAYETSSDNLKLAARSVIPSGMFGPDGGDRPPRAEAMITGVVAKSDRRTNDYSGAAFEWCLIETYAAQIDVVAEPQAAPFRAGERRLGHVLVGRGGGTPFKVATQPIRRWSSYLPSAVPVLRCRGPRTSVKAVGFARDHRPGASGAGKG